MQYPQFLYNLYNYSLTWVSIFIRSNVDEQTETLFAKKTDTVDPHFKEHIKNSLLSIL